MRITKQLLPKRLTDPDRKADGESIGGLPLALQLLGERGWGMRGLSFFVEMLNKLPTESAVPELGCKRIMRTCRRASGLLFDVAYVNNGMGT